MPRCGVPGCSKARGSRQGAELCCIVLKLLYVDLADFMCIPAIGYGVKNATDTTLLQVKDCFVIDLDQARACATLVEHLISPKCVKP